VIMTRQIVETEHHVVEFESKKLYKQVLDQCKELDINLDHWLFEFDLEPTEKE
jgi:hypothetical protein